MAVAIEEAVSRVRASMGEQHWRLLDATEQTRAIYREIRRLDLEETMNRRALARAAANADEADPQGSPAGLVEEPAALRCSAFIKARTGHRCGWHPVMTVDGHPYCGFHNPQRQTGRNRMPKALNANARPFPDPAVTGSRAATAAV